MSPHRKIFMAGAAVAMILAGCHRYVPRPHLHKRAEKVYHWKDGRYAYQSNDGFWFWYIYTSTGSTTPPSTSGTIGAGGAPPAAGSWARGAQPTPQDEEEAVTEELDIAETENGEPASEEAATEAGESTAEPAGAETSASEGSTSTSESSSSDSGGGGDGGGGD
jgi:hypothetical protein